MFFRSEKSTFFIAGQIKSFFFENNNNNSLKIDVLSSFFSQKRFMCASLRCLTEAILTSDLFLKENGETKVIYLT